MKEDLPNDIDGIAVIGMSARFPGSRDDLRTFWRNLCQGQSAVQFFDDEALLARGVDPDRLRDPFMVKAGVVLEDMDRFDAAFFDYTPREAELLDPQRRLLLECAYEAMERAGYEPGTCDDLVGIYAGGDTSYYLFENLATRSDLIREVGLDALVRANEKDYLATGIAYKLDLRGPAMTVSTACSTSLTATHLACRALLGYECDMALAGGSSIHVSADQGYQYQEGGVLSPDGHCRTFDADAKGTLAGSGVGMVLLKRLEDALADGDPIHAVIRGSAVNNDGALKAGYTAPSVKGQAEVIADALATAGVDADSIGYVEAHGTATPIGDPAEIRALHEVFHDQTDRRHYCAIGSLKSNMGHLSTAAGVAGLIKTVLACELGEIPPSLNFRQPNPRIDFENSPFYVITDHREWTGPSPRRAGVSSFGIGGTNVHAVIEQAPPRPASDPGRPVQPMLVSAKTARAADAAVARLVDHLANHPEIPLVDAAYTLIHGRTGKTHRRTLWLSVHDDRKQLTELAKSRVATHDMNERPEKLVLLFPGQGAQFPRMGETLYREEPAFRKAFDRCARHLDPHLPRPLAEIIYGNDDELAAKQLAQTEITQPALFAVGYATAEWWASLGIEPDGMLGHSIGEWVAAQRAGVVTLETAAALVVERGRLMAAQPPGGMLAVPAAADDLDEDLTATGCSLAAVNGPQRCTVAGDTTAIKALAQRLKARKVSVRPLVTSHAFHSTMMKPAGEAFVAFVSRYHLQAPERPFMSCLTGEPITEEQATSPAYWGRQLAEPVQYAKAVASFGEGCLFLEAGPGKTLTTLARGVAGNREILTTLPGPRDRADGTETTTAAIARLWGWGFELDWDAYFGDGRRHRVILPTYPFERKRYWIDPGPVNLFGDAPQVTVPQSSTDRDAEPHERPAIASPFQAPETPTEAAITEIWTALFSMDQVGVDDNFFELGGDSLLASQVVTRLRDKLQVEIAIEDFFDNPTVRDLASLVDVLVEMRSDRPDEAEVRPAEPEKTEARVGGLL